MNKTQITKTLGTILGTYGKGIEGSKTVNFSESGGKFCDLSCELHPENGGGCYAVTAGKRKPTIVKNGLKHSANFSLFLGAVRAMVKTLSEAPWIRFSAFGSISAPSTWTDSDKANLSQIAEKLDHSIVHFPVETLEKARALKDLGYFPRVSDGEASEAMDAGFPVSRVVKGTKRITGSMSRKRKHEVSAPARELARELRANGLSAKVCPAIVANAKCGDCTMCSGTSGVDVIIYPDHV
jgi:hypothetical protein